MGFAGGNRGLAGRALRCLLLSHEPKEPATMRTLTVAAGAALAACALDSASAFHVPGKAPLALATGRASARACKAAGPTMKVLTVNGKKLSKFEAMRFKAGRCAGGAGRRRTAARLVRAMRAGPTRTGCDSRRCVTASALLLQADGGRGFLCQQADGEQPEGRRLRLL